MPRSTLLFGNGLGMAADSHYFDLASAMQHAWSVEDDGALSDDDKLRVVRCVGSNDITKPPTSETDLDILQRVVAACDYLNQVGDIEVHWLSEDAQPFPDAVRRYLGRTAAYFHEYPHDLPSEFMDSLDRFIRVTESHVATLNYDRLLYAPFIGRRLCYRYDGPLVDGFHNAGFAADNLERRYGRRFGWYLHLHGSPLFAERDRGVVTKLGMSDLPYHHHLRKHLILTHYAFKPGLIQHSSVLKAYWDFFRRALQESNRLICFGYSGEDDHVNRVVKDMRSRIGFEIVVVEWSGAGPPIDRQAFWDSAFGATVQLTQRDNVLDYRFEALLPPALARPPRPPAPTIPRPTTTPAVPFTPRPDAPPSPGRGMP